MARFWQSRYENTEIPKNWYVPFFSRRARIRLNQLMAIYQRLNAVARNNAQRVCGPRKRLCMTTGKIVCTRFRWLLCSNCNRVLSGKCSWSPNKNSVKPSTGGLIKFLLKLKSLVLLVDKIWFSRISRAIMGLIMLVLLNALSEKRCRRLKISAAWCG